MSKTPLKYTVSVVCGGVDNSLSKFMFSGTTIHTQAALTNPLLKQMRNLYFCTWNLGILRPSRNLIKPKDIDGFLAALEAP